MVRTLEEVKGGGGSIKLGSTGTISTLISRELESSSSKSSLPSISYNDSTTPRKLGFRTSSSDEASSSRKGNDEDNNRKKPEAPRQTTKHYPNSKSHHHRRHRIPMLEADNMSVDGTPIRTKPAMKKKGVEVVDINCGRVKPITARLKKLGFSKLSDSGG